MGAAAAVAQPTIGTYSIMSATSWNSFRLSVGKWRWRLRASGTIDCSMTLAFNKHKCNDYSYYESWFCMVPYGLNLSLTSIPLYQDGLSLVLCRKRMGSRYIDSVTRPVESPGGCLIPFRTGNCYSPPTTRSEITRRLLLLCLRHCGNIPTPYVSSP